MTQSPSVSIPTVARMGHWQDLMELDSDPYVTSNSTMSVTSSVSELSWLESRSDSSVQDAMFSDAGRTARPLPAPDSRTTRGLHLSEAEHNESLYANDEEDEQKEDISMEQKPRISDRKKTQNERFSAWIAQRAETVTKEQVRKVVENTTDDLLSVRNLYAKQESKAIVKDARGYQKELFERAKSQNIIAVLDTGSGKTLIAVLLLQYTIDQELEHRAQGNKPRISFFLVDCVTLVFQQHAVLECNLDQAIGAFCGEMGCDLWDRRIWEKHFGDNMVIVCTAEVLAQCLMHSFIALDQINLLIFDEAHHAKKNHPYARIIRDYYIPATDPMKRPRIFGMTASPVDVKQDVVEAAKELEAMLDSQIATTADLSLLRLTVSRPKEEIVEYSRLHSPYLTTLSSELKGIVGELEAIQKVLAFARDATSQLGEWCADRVWVLALKEEEAQKIERKTERLFLASRDFKPVERLDEDMRRIKKAQELIATWEFPKLPYWPNTNAVSPKVKLLKKFLDHTFKESSKPRCIIFARKRYTARLLAEFLSDSENSNANLQLGLLIGTNRGEAGDVRVSFREQVMTLKSFREGKLNCLIATSIAEEGLDIPDCNVVVRFDLYDTMIQYIQSRGRARHPSSKYLHLVEAGNKLHLQTLSDVRSGESVMRSFCEALPADRLLQGYDCDLDNAFRKEKLMRRYTDPETGATLTYASSLVVLAHFVGCLPRIEGSILQPTFVMLIENKRYVCEVLLPEGAPITSAVGRPCSRKAIAKRSAAFEMCMMLRKAGHLDSNLIPTIKKYLPLMRNAHLALNSKKTHSYNSIVKPSFWQHACDSLPSKLYLTVLELAEPDKICRPSQPLALITRILLPDLPSMILHLQAGKDSAIICTSISNDFDVTEPMLTKLNSFTLCIYNDVHAKEFENNLQNTSYWLAPILNGKVIQKDCPDPVSLIDWSVIDTVVHHGRRRWTPDTPNRELSSKFLVDRFTGSRHFYSDVVLPNVKASDPILVGSPVDAKIKPHMRTSIFNYSVSMTEKQKEKWSWVPNQPVLRAYKVPVHLNWLDEFEEADRTTEKECYICPEPMFISSLPISVVSMALLFPAIFSRIESHLITLEGCEMLGLTIKPTLALEAMTKDSDNTEEHRAEQIHCQRGMGKNYERLEFIGDCFLKMATTISIFSLCPENDEFDYHCKRMEMICNKNLLNIALSRKLHEYIRTQGFQRRSWYPQGIKILKGMKGVFGVKHFLGDKTIADVCEALIGAALLSHENMDMAVKAVSVMVSGDYHNATKWSDYWDLYTKPAWQVASATASQIDLANKIEEKFNYRFEHPRLLRSAFIHPSYPFSYEKIPSYQRLEFLGDALLDMACIKFLYFRHEDRDPQWLTEHKMAMVSNKFLAALAVKLGFHRYLRSGQGNVEALVRDFVQEIEELERQANGGRDYWTNVKSPPKCLSDIVESYIGALFVDSEFNYKEVERFFEEHVRWFFEDMNIYDSFANNHPVTHLHNLLTLSFCCTNYRVMADELPSIDGSPPRNVAVVMIHDRIIADGEASSGKNAKVKACIAANDLLDGLGPHEYRKQYACDCAINEGMESFGFADVGNDA